MVSIPTSIHSYYQHNFSVLVIDYVLPEFRVHTENASKPCTPTRQADERGRLVTSWYLFLDENRAWRAHPFWRRISTHATCPPDAAAWRAAAPSSGFLYLKDDHVVDKQHWSGGTYSLANVNILRSSVALRWRGILLKDGALLCIIFRACLDRRTRKKASSSMIVHGKENRRLHGRGAFPQHRCFVHTWPFRSLLEMLGRPSSFSLL